ncbi:hypothetical protein JCM8547_007953 [Rhodosporidiobolus lusitaniae]
MPRDRERRTPSRVVWVAFAICMFCLVLFATLSLPEEWNLVPAVDWNVVLPASAKAAVRFEDLLFQTSSSRLSSSHCGISPDLLSEFHSHSFRLSQVHVGSGYRVQKVLDKAKRGEKIRIGVLGGSVSLGHGTDPKTGQRNKYGAVPVEEQWHQYVKRYFAELSGVEPELTMGAKAATDSSFFEWCWASLIGTELDLVLIEMAVNDEFKTSHDSSENLLRSLLHLDTQPAVIYADTFALRSGSSAGSILNGQDVQTSLASFYDVPQISARPALLPAMIHNPGLKKPLFLDDVRHGTTKLHRFLGSMIVGYLQEEGCRATESWLGEDDSTADIILDGNEEKRGEEDRFEWPGADELGTVPRVKMSETWDAKVNHATKPPTCSTAGAGLKPVNETKDWTLFNWKYSKYYYETLRADSDDIVFEADVREGAQGRLAISFLRSRQYNLGKARCSVGDQTAVLDGYWGASTSLAQTVVVARDLPPGKHRVSCKTLPVQKGDTGTAFRLMGVMTI